MEDVDRILLHTLREIGCDIDEDIRNLGQFDSNMIVDATVRCLELMQPGTQLPHSLPPNMATKYRVGQEIAQACKDQGYTGDIGYQTFLYSGESDIRKILMFLVEKLPKEEEKFVREPSSTEILMRRMKHKVKGELARPWLPHNAMTNEWTSEFRPYTDKNQAPAVAWRRFWREDLPLDGIDNSNILPTVVTLHSRGILSKYDPKCFITRRPGDTQRQEKSARDDNLVRRKPTIAPKPSLQANVDYVVEVENENSSQIITNEERLEHVVESLLEEVEQIKLTNQTLEQELCEESKDLEKTKELNHVKARVLELLPAAEDNTKILEKTIEDYSLKLVDLAQQWEKHRLPLVEKYRKYVALHSNRQNESAKKAETARSLSERRREMEQELKNKERLLDQLQVESERVGKEANRSAYTRRILEIIGNIDKQKLEISKVLKDTQDVQKEINSLSGQLDRSFAVADETIFADAKRDETSRKAYKLLVTLHSDCDQLVAMVQETGATLRDIRDLEDQIEKERNKDVAANLERITADLNQMKQESSHLATQLKLKQCHTEPS